MENRINVVLTEEQKTKLLSDLNSLRQQMPFLLKVSDADRQSIHQMDDRRRPFTEKACDFATRNDAINPGPGLVENAVNDLALYSTLAVVENELKQLLEMVTDTKQVAGAEAYEVARFVYMKAKMSSKMRIPGTDAIVDALAKLYKISSKPAAPKNEA